MERTKRFVAALTLAVVTTVMVAPAASAGPTCAPGQHGNKHPGYKPASCRK